MNNILFPSCFKQLCSRLLLFLFCFSILFLTVFTTFDSCSAAEVMLAWTANDPIEKVVGYRIYYGQVSRLDLNQQFKENFQYDFVIDLNSKYRCTPGSPPRNCLNVADQLDCSDLSGSEITCTYSGLDPDSAYYFTITAFNDRVESDYCHEEYYETPADKAPVVDTDNDGISDEDEINIYHTNPGISDTDNDGINDGDELAFWAEYWNCDFDNDGIINILDPDSDNDGIADGEEISQNSNPGIPPQLKLDIGIAGSILFNHNRRTIGFDKDIVDPVIIVGPATNNDEDPGVVRLTDVTDSSFAIKFQEWKYLEEIDGGIHDLEEVSFLALEKGIHYIGDGSVWVVGSFDIDNNRAWLTVPFPGEFPDVPELFLTIQTSNDPDPVIVRAGDISPTEFRAEIFNEEKINLGDRSTEKIGYLAIYQPDTGGEVKAGDKTVPYLLDNNVTDHNFSSVLGYEMKIQEEQSLDDETLHLKETFNVLNLKNLFFVQDISWSEADPFSVRKRASFVSNAALSSKWHTVTLSTPFVDQPIIIAGPPTYTDTDPGMVRIDKVNGNSFKIKFEEWKYLADQGNPAHDVEHASYLAIKKGRYLLDDGSIWEAGDFTISGLAQWQQVNFVESFTIRPVLFFTVQTTWGTELVTVRVEDLTRDGFSAALYAQESSMATGNSFERIGYLAISPPDYYGTTFESEQEIYYGVELLEVYSNFSPILGRDVKLEEEQSLDGEMSHQEEAVNAMRINSSFFANCISTYGPDTLVIRKIEAD